MNHIFDYPNIFFKIKLVAAAAPITTRGPLFATKSHTLSFISRIPDSFKGLSTDQSTCYFSENYFDGIISQYI